MKIRPFNFSVCCEKERFFFFFFLRERFFVHLSVGLCEVYADRPLTEGCCVSQGPRTWASREEEVGSMSHFLELKALGQRGFDSYSVQRDSGTCLLKGAVLTHLQFLVNSTTKGL